MLASFSVVPLGLTGGVKELVAEVLKIVDASDVDYELGAMQTTVEGDAKTVMETLLACHRRMLELAPRVLTHIAIDERKGATGRLEGKVRDVEEVLGKPLRRKRRIQAGREKGGKSEARVKVRASSHRAACAVRRVVL